MTVANACSVIVSSTETVLVSVNIADIVVACISTLSWRLVSVTVANEFSVTKRVSTDRTVICWVVAT